MVHDQTGGNSLLRINTFLFMVLQHAPSLEGCYEQ